VNKTSSKPSIVLVHGAWADASCWRHNIPKLLDEEYDVSAPQLPESSVADDVKKVKTMLDSKKGPIVVVAHSYGGMVATEAAANRNNVKALIYLSAFALDAGETLNKILKGYTPTPALSAIAPDPAGYFYINKEKFREVFAQDVDEEETRVMAVTQKPLAGAVLDQTINAAAWKNVPSWFIITTEDRVVHPDIQRFVAKRMNANITEIKASHASFISKPDIATNLILEVAKMVTAGKIERKEMKASAM
jgi:pimeloyl-ACP methyl ester carboxylesterase